VQAPPPRAPLDLDGPPIQVGRAPGHANGHAEGHANVQVNGRLHAAAPSRALECSPEELHETHVDILQAFAPAAGVRLDPVLDSEPDSRGAPNAGSQIAPEIAHENRAFSKAAVPDLARPRRDEKALVW